MSNQLVRAILRSSVSRRALSTSVIRSQDVTIDQATKDRAYPKLGNRDIVGYGINGIPGYVDKEEWPCPAVRFKENTPDVLALREKEKGDWKKLSLEEKKALYRASFCQTYSEMNAPTGEWKTVLAGVLCCLSVAGWVVIWMKQAVYPPLPRTINREWQEAGIRRQVLQRQGRVEGVASNFDYEKNTWK